MLPFTPMRLAFLREAFDHPDWVFELKYDGFRSLAVCDGNHEACLEAEERVQVLPAGIAVMVPHNVGSMIARRYGVELRATQSIVNTQAEDPAVIQALSAVQ